MEADWDEVSRVVVPPSGPHSLPTPASTIAFDDSQELLWVGSDHVSLTAIPLEMLDLQVDRSREE
jgi:PAB-dependent poly(A)-specific ribonuclease subunit 2